MRTAVSCVFLAAILAAPQAFPAEDVEFVAADGVRVHGYLYRADAASDAPVILLFHQAGGDARGEYGPLVGRLNESGYHALAIDQRVGGNRFGGVNQTAQRLEGDDYGYCDAYPDLEAALDFVLRSDLDGRIAVWGSSYSAALVFQLAANRQADVDAVLAFSPASGEPLAACRPEQFSGDIAVPVLALRPAREMQVPSVPPQMDRFRADGHRTHVADPGVHGSSMLDSARVGESTEATWSVVLDFLRGALSE